MKYNVLITAPPILPKVENYQELFNSKGIMAITPDFHVVESLSSNELNRLLPDIDAILCGDDDLNAEVLEKATKLKVISKWGTGIDSIDSDAAKRLGKKVFRVKDIFSAPVADTVMSYLLIFSRRILQKDALVREDSWSKVTSYTLSEKTLGIVGLGHIGRTLAKRAEAFDMNILYTDIKRVDTSGIKVTEVSLETLLQESDFISIHCDLNKSSYRMFNKAQFEVMKKDAIIINTARGTIINELDLINAIEGKLIGGAALDVFENEPLPPDNRLKYLKNVFLSPHNSNASPDVFNKVDIASIENIFLGLGL